MAEFAVAIFVGLCAGVLWLLQFTIRSVPCGILILAILAAAAALHILYRLGMAHRCLKSVKGMKQEPLIRYYFGQFSTVYHLSYIISVSVYEILLCSNQSMKFYKISRESVENGLAKRSEDYFLRTILAWNRFLAAVRYNAGYRKRMAEVTSLELINEKIKESAENPEAYRELEGAALAQAQEGKLKAGKLAGLDPRREIPYMFRRNLLRMDRLNRTCAVYESKLKRFHETAEAVESDIKAVARRNKG